MGLGKGRCGDTSSGTASLVTASQEELTEAYHHAQEESIHRYREQRKSDPKAAARTMSQMLSGQAVPYRVAMPCIWCYHARNRHHRGA